MKIFIIGASGLVGSHCFSYFNSKGWEVVGTHLNFATDDTVYFNPSGVDFEKDFDLTAYDPDVILHCGALTNVDYCESHPEESEYSTVFSIRNMADFCRKNNTKLVYISTDYLFDGKNGPYLEDVDPSPINVYGSHKLIAENISKTVDKFIVARITNVYGEEARSKNFIARLIIWLTTNEEKKLDLPIDQFATPVYAGDIARMLFCLISDQKTGIYNLSSTDYYDRYHLALKVKSFFPHNDSVVLKHVETAVLKQPAARPLSGGLLNHKFIAQYPTFEFTNIDAFLKKTIV